MPATLARRRPRPTAPAGPAPAVLDWGKTLTALIVVGLVKDPASPDPVPDRHIVRQEPPAGIAAPKGATVLVTYG
ncbi:hypothetical protein [Streptomyces sp. Y1]|uniref:PASTA domain-containing protein n=1 Tax=Streptomyces sp. Y1 TaxID=3238634 RepID=A0AB39TFR3_9ACTN